MPIKFLPRLATVSASLVILLLGAFPMRRALASLQATRHWNHMPVSVYFEGGGTSTPDRIFSAENGFLEWTTASRGVLQYTLADDAADADVVVRFVPTIAVSHGVVRVGETKTESHGPVLRHATIQLTTSDVDFSQLSEEAAHEWGHALGITDHSTDPQDLMYPTTIRVFDTTTGEFRPTPKRSVSADDLRAIGAVYGALFRPKKARPQEIE